MALVVNFNFGTILSTSEQIICSFSSGLGRGGTLMGMQLTNATTSEDAMVTVFRLPTTSLASTPSRRIARILVPAGDVVPLPGGPFYASSGSAFSAYSTGATAGAATSVCAFPSAFQE